MQKQVHVMSEYNRLPKEWLIRGLFHLPILLLGNKLSQNTWLPTKVIVSHHDGMDLNRFEEETVFTFTVPTWNFSLKMTYLNMSQDNLKWPGKQYFWGTRGDLPVVYGAAGGHSVVRGQVVGLENPSWLIPMSGARAGISGRLDSMDCPSEHPQVALPAWWLEEERLLRGILDLQEEVTHIHPPFLAGVGNIGSKNVRPCFKTAKDGSPWRTEANVQSMELAHSMYFRS